MFSWILLHECGPKHDINFKQQFKKQEVNIEWVYILDTICLIFSVLAMKLVSNKAGAEHLHVSEQHSGVLFMN